MKSPAMLTNAPTILPNAPATVMMSWKVSDLSVSMIRLRHRAHERHQACERALEPGPGPRDRVALLDVLPDLLLADQLHEAADQGLGGARHRFAGDRVLAQDHAQQVVAARALRQRGQRLQDRVLDHLSGFRWRRSRRRRSAARSAR